MVFLFLKLGSEVVEGETQSFDQRILQFAQALRARYPALAEIMRDLTALGSTAVLTLFTVVTVVYLALFGTKRMAALVAVSMISGVTLVSVFKGLFDRARPDSPSPNSRLRPELPQRPHQHVRHRLPHHGRPHRCHPPACP